MSFHSEKLRKNFTQPLELLFRLHEWMKEKGYLQDLLRHFSRNFVVHLRSNFSIDILRDNNTFQRTLGREWGLFLLIWIRQGN